MRHLSGVGLILALHIKSSQGRREERNKSERQEKDDEATRPRVAAERRDPGRFHRYAPRPSRTICAVHALPCPSWQAALLALSAEIAGGLGGD
ncbi:hypothetical protein SC1_01514 [Sphingopyxis sp. C-1]|nr:hypothetical protein SC1_01514 [Sphingopyxis sp. C-1]